VTAPLLPNPFHQKPNMNGLGIKAGIRYPAPTMANHRELSNFIWQIADLLRGPFFPPQYERVKSPMTILLSNHPEAKFFASEQDCPAERTPRHAHRRRCNQKNHRANRPGMG
jgi:hypothetical protein